MNFEQILQEFRDKSFSERDKGYRFERLMQSFLKTYPVYADLFTKIWLWNEFPSRGDFGSGDKDLGIDIVAMTKYGDYWAVQCKCYKEDARIDKPKVDTFLSTSGKSAIEWVMERYSVTTHKESGIKNDPNDWAKEHENPQYILDLLLSVIMVSVNTVNIVAGLPKVEWE